MDFIKIVIQSNRFRHMCCL